MRYFVIKNTRDKSYWGYPDGKADALTGKPSGWTKDYDQMHLYETEVKLRYAKAEVVKLATDVPAKYIEHTEVWL